MSAAKNPGRFAGLLYILTSIIGFFGLGYVPGKLIIQGDTAATASNIAASEMLFRFGIAGSLIGQAGFIFVAMALHDLLKGVNRRHASLMVTLIVVSIPIAFLNELNSFAALVLVKGADFASVFDKPQREALAMLFLTVHGRGFVVAEMFWVWLLYDDGQPLQIGLRWSPNLGQIASGLMRAGVRVPAILALLSTSLQWALTEETPTMRRFGKQPGSWPESDASPLAFQNISV